MWSDDGLYYERKASEVVMGDRVVAWDGEELAPSKVRKVIRGISTSNYILHNGYNQLGCSFSHRNIADMEDFEHGTSVKKLSTCVMYRDSELITDKITKEIIESKASVITFELEKGKRNFIANSFFNHNLKEYAY